MNFDKYDYMFFLAFCLIVIGVLSPYSDNVKAAIVIVGIIIGLYALWVYSKEFDKNRKENNERKQEGNRDFNQCKIDFEEFVAQNIKLKPCSRCADIDYVLLDINSVGTSVQLQCRNCNRTAWFKELKVDESIYDKNRIISLWNNFHALITEQQREYTGNNCIRFYAEHINMNNPLQDVLNEEDDNEENRSRSISQEVKDKVWNRDGGKCVQCDSNEDLEFDHIIPHSKGGANTYRNIQLLCEPCNRKKSAKIG